MCVVVLCRVGHLRLIRRRVLLVLGGVTLDLCVRHYGFAKHGDCALGALALDILQFVDIFHC